MVIPLRDDNPTRGRAYVTLLIIALNVAVYFAVQPHGADDARFTYEHAAIPCELKQQAPLNAFEYNTGTCDAASVGVAAEIAPNKSVWLAVLASMFLHGSLLHIGGNMLFLWIFGNNVEDYLGKLGFALFYLVAGIAAAATHFLSDPSSVIPVVGASGAIAGVMGMYLVLWPHARVLSLVGYFVLPIPAGILLAIWFAMQFLTGDNTGVAWVAHVGGFAFGALVGVALKSVRPAERTAPAVD